MNQNNAKKTNPKIVIIIVLELTCTSKQCIKRKKLAFCLLHNKTTIKQGKKHCIRRKRAWKKVCVLQISTQLKEDNTFNVTNTLNLSDFFLKKFFLLFGAIFDFLCTFES